MEKKCLEADTQAWSLAEQSSRAGDWSWRNDRDEVECEREWGSGDESGQDLERKRRGEGVGGRVKECTVPDAILDQYYCYRGQRRQMYSKDRPEDRSEEMVRRAFFRLRHLVHSALLFLSFL